MQQFNASVIISEQLNRLMVNAAQELAQRAVTACAEHYNFDAEEAIRLLGLNNVKLERKSAVKDEEVKEKVVIPKPKFPLPYNEEFNDTYCYALRQNNGLYTQCSGVRGDAQFCKSCAKQMQKTGSDIPEYGTIQQRQAVGIFEYVDPKGRKPIAYTKLMKKYKISQQEVVEEAGKFNITINNEHFIAPEEETKRGRRKNEDKKEEKPKGAKGRPKKEKKVIQLEGDDDDTDLFAALVEEANNAQEENDVVVSNEEESAEEEKEPSSEDDELLIAFEKMEIEGKKEQERVEREAKKNAEEEEKAAKAAKKEQERIEREAKKKAEEEEKAAKAAKKEQERIEREAKKKAEEEEKAAKAAKKEQERVEREAKKKAEEEEKAAKKSSKKEKEVKPANEEEEDDDEDDEEPDIVKKIEHDGKKYLKSKKTGIIYDYTKYVKDGEQIKVGRWNEKTNKIDFEENDEESEEEYDE